MVRTIQSIRTEKIRVLRRQAAPPQFLAAGHLKDLRHAADGAPPQSLTVAVVCLAQSRLVSSCRVVSRSWLARDYPPSSLALRSLARARRLVLGRNLPLLRPLKRLRRQRAAAFPWYFPGIAGWW